MHNEIKKFASSILNNPNYQFLLVCYDITETADDATLHAKINDLNKGCFIVLFV